MKQNNNKLSIKLSHNACQLIILLSGQSQNIVSEKKKIDTGIFPGSDWISVMGHLRM